MTCENIFCIYQQQDINKCTLDKITLNNTGTCDDCIYIDINKHELQKLKNLLLKKYNYYFK